MRTSVAEVDWAARRWSPSKVRTSVAEVDCLAGCSTRRGEMKRALRLMFVFLFSSGGFSPQNSQAYDSV